MTILYQMSFKVMKAHDLWKEKMEVDCVCVHKGVFELQVTDFKNMFLF